MQLTETARLAGNSLIIIEDVLDYVGCSKAEWDELSLDDRTWFIWEWFVWA